MAKISRDDVLKLAKLSRLHLSDNELNEFTGELEAILNYVEQLQGVDLKGVQPTFQVTGLKNVMRSDEPIEYGVSKEELLKNAPAQNDGYIKVRRVLE